MCVDMSKCDAGEGGAGAEYGTAAVLGWWSSRSECAGTTCHLTQRMHTHTMPIVKASLSPQAIFHHLIPLTS